MIFRQVEELQKSLQATSSKSTENSMTLELQYKEELQQALEKERLSSNKKQEALRWELQNTRTDIMRLEQQYSLREDILRKEISDLQQVFYALVLRCFSARLSKSFCLRSN